MRPIYEDEKTKKLEWFISQVASDVWGSVMAKMPMSYHIDFIGVFRGGGRFIAEAKWRNFHQWGQYDTVMLSALKWMTAKRMCEDFNIPFTFIVGTFDGMYFFKKPANNWIPPIDPTGGRTKQTRDSADIEPVVHLPTGSFERVATRSDYEMHDGYKEVADIIEENFVKMCGKDKLDPAVQEALRLSWQNTGAR